MIFGSFGGKIKGNKKDRSGKNKKALCKAESFFIILFYFFAKTEGAVMISRVLPETVRFVFVSSEMPSS